MKYYLYILCFDKKYKHAKHYIGITNNIERRMKEHRSGRKSARLLQVLKENNIDFTHNIIANFPDYSSAKSVEKYIKCKIKNSKRYCPICNKGKRNENNN